MIAENVTPTGYLFTSTDSVGNMLELSLEQFLIQQH